MKRHKQHTLILGLIGLTILALSTGPVFASTFFKTTAGLGGRGLTQENTTVSLETLPVSVSDCGVAELFVDVNNVTNLYGVDFRLSFDPTVIEVVDMNPGGNVNIAPEVDTSGSFSPPYTANFPVRNVVDNFRGTIWYASASTNPTLPAEGSGHVARFQIRAKTDGDPNFQFTYIKLSDPNGVEIPATGVITPGSSVSTSVVPDLDIIRLDAGTVQLQWPAVNASTVNQYHIYRSTTPYFYADGSGTQVVTTVSNPGSGTLTFDDAVLGSVDDNYFYAVRAECTVPAGSLSAPSDQVGKFEFELYETGRTDYSWIGINLLLDGVTDSADLAAHIEANSNSSVDVISISTWNALAQQLDLYLDDPFEPAFNVNIKFPYQIEVDIPGTLSGSVIWAQVGRLPQITDDTYTLYETNRTDYNWILQPLDMTTISSTKNLISDIVSNSSGPVGVISLSKWNGPAQQFDVFFPEDNSPSRFGYPYQVEVNVNIGTSVTWP